MITIIIPTYNRPYTINKVLFSYLNQRYVKELIIIDDASELDYRDVVKENILLAKQKEISLVYYRMPGHTGSAACREKGIELATQPFVCWGEDDVFLSLTYCDVLMDKVLKNINTIYCGSIYNGITPWMYDNQKTGIIESQQKAIGDLFDYNLFKGHYQKIVQDDQKIPFGHALILGPAEAFKKVLYAKIYEVNGYREESDSQLQMQMLGYQIFYTSDTCCYHFPGDEVVENNSGQHHCNVLVYQWYKILNTCKFYDRFFPLFKERKYIAFSKTHLKMIFVMDTISNLCKIVYNKFLKLIIQESC